MVEIALCNPAGLLASSDMAGAAEGIRDTSKGSVCWAERAIGGGRTKQPEVRAVAGGDDRDGRVQGRVARPPPRPAGQRAFSAHVELARAGPLPVAPLHLTARPPPSCRRRRPPRAAEHRVLVVPA